MNPLIPTKKLAISAVSISLVTAPAAFLAGCDEAPGTAEQQGAAVGGVGGALAGYSLSEDNRALGALIGALVGAGGGYVVGGQLDKSEEEAQEAAEEARQNPATVEEARDSETADLDGNGFVTMDELKAMEAAGLTDEEIVDRARETGQVFQFSDSQTQELADAGIDRDTIAQIERVNREQLREQEEDPGDRISSEPGAT